MFNESELLTTRQAAKFLGLSAGTLCIWRCRKRYELRYYKLGGAVRYRMRDLEAFLKSRARAR